MTWGEVFKIELVVTVALIAGLAGGVYLPRFHYYRASVAIGLWWRHQLRVFGRFVLRQAGPDPAITARVSEAIQRGFDAAGLPTSSNVEGFDVMGTGKFHELSFYAAARLEVPLRTVGDLRHVLQKVCE